LNILLTSNSGSWSLTISLKLSPWLIILALCIAPSASYLIRAYFSINLALLLTLLSIADIWAPMPSMTPSISLTTCYPLLWYSSIPSLSCRSYPITSSTAYSSIPSSLNTHSWCRNFKVCTAICRFLYRWRLSSSTGRAPSFVNSKVSWSKSCLAEVIRRSKSA
jgi:hypothetical protein